MSTAKDAIFEELARDEAERIARGGHECPVCGSRESTSPGSVCCDGDELVMSIPSAD